MRNSLFLAAALSAALFCGWLVYGTEHVTVSSLLERVDRAYPGRGTDVHHETPADYAMAYCLIASSAARLGDADLMHTAADWAIGNRSPTGGWGLPFAWDRFRDGTVNPPNTATAITTALCVQGLLDVFGKTRDERYLRTAIDALEKYAPYHTKTEAGLFFHYTVDPWDAKNVFNASAMLGSQYVRAGAIADRKDFAELGRKAIADLWRNRIQLGDEVYWLYGTMPKSRPNDSLHAAYLVYALLVARENGVNIGDLTPAIRHLSRFERDGSIYELPFSLKRNAKPARPWGVGMLIATWFAASDAEAARLAKKSLTHPKEIRHAAHILFGLAHEEGAKPHLVMGNLLR